MHINIYGKNITITAGIESAINENFKKIEEYVTNKYGKDIANSTNVNISLEVKKKRHKVEISFILDGQLFRAEDDLEDMYVSISSDVKKIETQIKKYSKIKISKKHKDRNNYVETSNEDVIDDEEFIANEIVFSKTKFVNLSKMTPEDAIEQMIYIGHDFYLFINEKTDTTDVVYMRKDGTYGLISTNH